MPIPEKSYHDYFTYTQYKNWPDNERWELVEGQAFDMSPAPGMTHQNISLELSRQIANYLQGKPCKVFTAPFDVFLPSPDEKEENTSTILQPDITIICDAAKLSEKGCTGAPDIVIEILSPSSASRDLITKLDLYEKHRIKEYWIIHPGDKIVWKYVLNKDTFGKPLIFDHTFKPSFTLFQNLQIDLAKVFGIKDNETIHEPSPKSYKTK